MILSFYSHKIAQSDFFFLMSLNINFSPRFLTINMLDCGYIVVNLIISKILVLMLVKIT